MIATFYSLSVSGITMGGYPNIVLIISCWAFFFNKKMACSSSISVFMASASNSIIKSAVFFFPCLKVSIFYSVLAVFVLLLNIILSSFTKSFQFWVPSSSSSSLSFYCAYIPTTPPLRWARITMILSSVSMILLLLRNNLILLHQSSNFVRSLSNHSGSSTMFFNNPAWLFSWPVTSIHAGAGAVNISISVYLSFVLSSEVSICKDPSRSNNALISSVCLELIVVLSHSFCYMCFISDRYFYLVSSFTPLLQCKLLNVLLNVTTLSKSSGCT